MKGILAMAAGVAAAAGAGPSGTEWKDPENLSFGREERRAAFSSFDSLENALKILPEFSERTLCLDSDTEWKFKWAPDPASRPAGFEKPSFDASAWETIKVPCSWQAFGANGNGGWGTPIYTNQTYPFKRDQPDVMGEPPADWTAYSARNPVGSYRRDFDVPEAWAGLDLFLKFDAVDSFFYLWVNGEYVGFSKDSRNPAEFDVTRFVRPGRNTVALEVYRYSDGSYLEDQDMFRLSGIARSTWLLARPKARVRDFTATPRPVDPADLGGDWILEIAADAVGGAAVDAALYDFDGNAVATKKAADGLSLVVPSPKLWSAESPNCYKLVLAVGRDMPAMVGRVAPNAPQNETTPPRRVEGNAPYQTSELLSCLVGFRVSEIRDGRYFFNGKKIKLRGVNRHETDPMFGHFVPRERQLEDVRLMKEANINHVRNSHYPQDDYFYHLCDVYGIYVLDEANVESHGYYYGEASLSHRPEWRAATVARNIDMVRRNRNHPSVVMWSLGNEAGPGENFAAASAAVRAADPTRPIQYERDNSVADMDSNQYPGVDWVQWKASDAAAAKPFYISEYAHNMCNAMGNLKDYQDAIESSDVILGAAIWDWVDQGLWKRNADGKMILAYGGDFGDKPNDGQFVMNGTILSDRRLEPGYWEVKHVFQPFAFALSGDRRTVTVTNLNYFRGTDGLTIRIGDCVALPGDAFSATFDVPPRASATFPVPEWLAAAGGAVACRVVLDRDEGVLKAGHVVASHVFQQPNRQAPFALPRKGEVKDASDGDSLAFSADGFSCRFDRKSGALVSFVMGGKEALLAPMTLDAFRAPSSNEVGLGERWAMAGLRDLVQTATSISPVAANRDGSKSFTVVADVRGRQRERLVGFGGRTGLPCEIVPAGPVQPSDTHFSVAQKWTVYANGSLVCQSEIRPRGRTIELARIGYRFTLDKRFGQVTWYGAGPFENYPDRKSGAFVGGYHMSVADMVEGYAKPQDMGNREDVSSASLSNWSPKMLRPPEGDISFFGIRPLYGETFSFSAIPYSPTELALAMHPQELPEIAKTELGIYAAVRGLGGASCGPGPLGRDVVRSNKTFKMDFILGKIDLPGSSGGSFFWGNKNGIPEVPPADLPPDVRTGEDIVPVVVECTSAEPGEGDADRLVDGDPATYWHSQYGVTLTKYPHSVTVDMGREIEAAKGVSIWQRPNGPNGNVKDFRFEVSADGKSWTTALASSLRPGSGEQRFDFAAPARLRFWRITALNEHYGREFASLAEVRLR